MGERCGEWIYGDGVLPLGEVRVDRNGNSWTWTRLPDGTEDWELTSLLQIMGEATPSSRGPCPPDLEDGN